MSGNQWHSVATNGIQWNSADVLFKYRGVAIEMETKSETPRAHAHADAHADADADHAHAHTHAHAHAHAHLVRRETARDHIHIEDDVQREDASTRDREGHVHGGRS